MLLMYYRLYITHEFLGFLFELDDLELDDSNVGRNINPLEPLLAQVFRVERRRIEAEEEEIEKLFFDATEQPIQRPSSKKPRREHYSGKQGDHTIKHQIAVDETGQIQAVSHSYPGRVHDKRIYQAHLRHRAGRNSSGDRSDRGSRLSGERAHGPEQKIQRGDFI